ncbi:MAG: cytochrome c [Chloroflexota bacterium]|nr:cytochrome c [Chloroflexota bacterium]MDE2941774.1 cytochrome c [Chloroflexota bacterium]MDE3268092.1 cytochrome c [Chloroflexota bacterium]
MTIVVLLTAAIGLACGGGGADPTNTPAPTTPPTATTAPVEPTATSASVPDPTEPTSGGAVVEGDAEIGKEIATNQGCIACHSWDGTEIVGPTWKGLWGTTRQFEDGGSAVVDEAFVKESIREPDKRIEVGFPAGTMPVLPLSDQDIEHIIALFKSLQ